MECQGLLFFIEVTKEVEEEEKLLIFDVLVSASAVLCVCRRADALLSLNLVRVGDERLRLEALCLASALSSQVYRA